MNGIDISVSPLLSEALLQAVDAVDR